MAGRVLAIGDVHGCHRALDTLISVLSPTLDDTVIFLGDLVDRGPSSKEVMNCVLTLRKECKVVVIGGNHEEMMRHAISGNGLLNTWLDAGGQATVDSYDGSLDNVPPEHIRLLVTTSPFYETDTDIFVHASLESDLALSTQSSDFLRWKHIGGNELPHVSGKRVICGHTAQTDGVPLVFDGWVCIDTYPHGGQWLTCLDVVSNHIYQASQDGGTREFPLSRYA